MHTIPKQEFVGKSKEQDHTPGASPPEERRKEMFKPEFKERGLVRAVIVVDLERSGCVDARSKEAAEERGNIWAVGKWYRDDERNLQYNLEKDFNALYEAYTKIGGNSFGGCVYAYEYVPYRK